MKTVTLVTMLFTVGVVWGGFLFVLRTALRKERLKETRKESGPSVEA